MLFKFLARRCVFLALVLEAVSRCQLPIFSEMYKLYHSAHLLNSLIHVSKMSVHTVIMNNITGELLV